MYRFSTVPKYVLEHVQVYKHTSAFIKQKRTQNVYTDVHSYIEV